MISMNSDVRAKWVDALRSDEYGQTNGCLSDGEGCFCCLGVLCDLYAKEHTECDWETKVGAMPHTVFVTGQLDGPDAKEEESYPGDEVRRWAGMTFDDCLICGSWNDDDCLTFDEIADNLEG